jgi:hypothetical protein
MRKRTVSPKLVLTFKYMYYIRKYVYGHYTPECFFTPSSTDFCFVC